MCRFRLQSGELRRYPTQADVDWFNDRIQWRKDEEKLEYKAPPAKGPKSFRGGAQKAVGFTSEIIYHISAPGDMVFLACEGTGTATEVCAVLGRKSVGVDIDPLSEVVLHCRMTDLRATPMIHSDKWKNWRSRRNSKKDPDDDDDVDFEAEEDAGDDDQQAEHEPEEPEELEEPGPAEPTEAPEQPAKRRKRGV